MTAWKTEEENKVLRALLSAFEDASAWTQNADARDRRGEPDTADKPERNMLVSDSEDKNRMHKRGPEAAPTPPRTSLPSARVSDAQTFLAES